jgi:hypothetical protein
MVLCRYCRKNVKPKIYLTWKGFICGLGIFYLIYVIMKIPQCPNCNFPMPWRSTVFAFHPPQQLIKLARMSVLQLILFKNRVMSISHRSAPSQHFASINTRQTTYINMMECGLKTTLNLSEPTVKKGDVA